MSDFKKRVRLAVLTLALIIPCIIVTLSVTAAAATLTVYAEETESCEHAYENGFCTSCDAYEPCEGDGSETNPYLISNAGNLYWFAQTVNSDGGEDICAKVTEDIIVNSDVLTADGELNGDGTNLREWTPIGSRSNWYNGTFDGNGKTIRGLYCKFTEVYQYAGLVGGFGEGTIKNIHVEDSYLFSYKYAGGIVGYITDAVKNKNRKISGCSNKGWIEGSSSMAYVGGIVGFGTTDLIIEDCYNTGTVYVDGRDSHVGGIIGQCNQSVTIKNCYNTGSVTGKGNVGGIVGYDGLDNTITNCYYLINCAVDYKNTFQNGIGNKNSGETTEDIDGSTTAKTAEEFASGEVTYLLNGSKSVSETGESLVWGQRIYYDEVPKFGGEVVYYLKAEDSSPEAYFYSNNDKAARPHKFDEVGFCTEENCDIPYLPCKGKGTDKSPYLIANAGNLYWFAQTVNSAGGEDICAKVTADIIVNSDVLTVDGELNGNGTKFREWTPIGSKNSSTNNYYSGTFNGQDHSISGLYYNNESEDHKGLFALVNNATIENVHIKDSYFCGKEYVGSLIGRITKTVVMNNCSSSSTVRGKGRYCGGLIGGTMYGNYSISNSYNTGSVRGKSFVGGIAGRYANRSTIVNCYNTGSITGQENVGGIIGNARYKESVVNCYNTGSVSGQKYVGGIVGQSTDGEITNSYYLIGCAKNSSGVVQNGIGFISAGNSTIDIDGSTTAKTAEEFASGEVTYLLNGSKSVPDTGESLLWYQTAGEGLPAFSGNIIYCGHYTCAKEYTNDSRIPTERPEHTDEDSDKKCDVCEEWLYGVELKGSNITLAGNIGLNYYFAFDDAESIMTANDATVRFIMADDRVADVPANDGIEDTSGGASGGLYKYSCELYAKQMTDKVKVQFIIDGNIILEYEQRVVDYANAIIKNKNGEYSEDAIALVKAMLNYGANAQLNFNYNTDNLANEKLLYSEKKLTGVLKAEELDTVLGGKKTKVTAVEGVGTFIGSSLVLESETTLKVYFEPCEGVEAGTLKFTVDGKDVEAAASGEYLVIAVTDIKANELNTDFTISVSSNGQGGEFKTSVYGYCYRVLKGADGEFTDELKNTVKALYCYSEAAQKYIGK